jgi:hypothetical protein
VPAVDKVPKFCGGLKTEQNDRHIAPNLFFFFEFEHIQIESLLVVNAVLLSYHP